MTGGPLEGVRVVEASSFVTGPAASRTLADLGAEVVKVEPPRGDPFRRFGAQHGGEGLLFWATNQNKRFATIDLKSSAGPARLLELLTDADVLITNWRPGVAERLGLTAERVCDELPHVTWVRISAYGQSGPDAELPAFDAIVQARSGLIHGGVAAPELVPMYVVDKVTGILAAQAALAAILERARTSRGSLVDISMLDAIAYFNSWDVAAGHGMIGLASDEPREHIRSLRPLPTADGWLVVSPVTGQQLKRTLAVAAHPEWAARLKEAPDSVSMVRLLMDLLEGVTPERSTAAWMVALREADVPAGEVLDLARHFEDPQVVHNETYVVAEGADGTMRRMARHPARFARG